MDTCTLKASQGHGTEAPTHRPHTWRPRGLSKSVISRVIRAV